MPIVWKHCFLFSFRSVHTKIEIESFKWKWWASKNVKKLTIICKSFPHYVKSAFHRLSTGEWGLTEAPERSIAIKQSDENHLWQGIRNWTTKDEGVYVISRIGNLIKIFNLRKLSWKNYEFWDILKKLLWDWILLQLC